MTDPIADMLTRMRNAQQRKHEAVYMPASKLKVEILRLFKAEGFIHHYKMVGELPAQEIKVYLKYDERGVPVISGLTRVSKPGCRVYVGKDARPDIRGGMGISVLSTSRGLMTHRRARRAQVGGEVLCQIW